VALQPEANCLRIKGILRFAKGLPIQVGSLPSPSWETSVHRSVTGSSSQLAHKKPALNDLAFHPAFLLDSPPCRLSVWSRRDCSGRCETLPFSLYTGKREGLFLSSSFSPPPSLFSLLSVLARGQESPPSPPFYVAIVEREEKHQLWFPAVHTPASPLLNRPSAAQRSILNKAPRSPLVVLPSFAIGRKDFTLNWETVERSPNCSLH
jgi:hypothetical protein